MSLLTEINRQQNHRYKVFGYGDNWKVVDGNKTVSRFTSEEDAQTAADDLEKNGPEEPKEKNELQKYFDTGLEHMDDSPEETPPTPFLKALGFSEV